jgi:hypothetical protein
MSFPRIKPHHLRIFNVARTLDSTLEFTVSFNCSCSVAPLRIFPALICGASYKPSWTASNASSALSAFVDRTGMLGAARGCACSRSTDGATLCLATLTSELRGACSGRAVNRSIRDEVLPEDGRYGVQRSTASNSRPYIKYASSAFSRS